MYSSVEDELWKIFTFYAIHADFNQPELLRAASFVRFCRDTQIISRKITATSVELEVARAIRLSNKQDVIGYDKAQLGISFTEFLNLLDVFALKVFSKDAPELAVKRLLLENVFLLACRRVPTNDIYDLTHAESNKVIKDIFGRQLRKIFEYYLDLADKRRNQAITAEKMQQKDLRNATNKDLTEIAASRQSILQSLRDDAKGSKNLINYKEYIQFCYDFDLKSTSLLTAVQIGEIYLNVVPLNTETKSESGMDFELFCQSVVYMACVAYRDVDSRVTQESKVKALLLYMWKAVNDNHKTSRLVSNNRNNTLSQFAGSLNIFGSGSFSDAFLSYWMKDNFVDYSSYQEENDRRSGSAVIKNVVSDSSAAESGNSSNTNKNTQQAVDQTLPSSSSPQRSVGNLMDSLQKSLTISAIANEDDNGGEGSPQQRRTNSVYVKHFGSTVHSRTVYNHYDSNEKRLSQRWRSGGTTTLTSAHLAELFRIRPELSEYVLMEIQNQRLSESLNV